jgi:LemA protein
MKKMSGGLIAVIVIVVLLVILVGSGISSYNSLVSLNENVELGKANIETQLQRRLDLIPNFVNTVKGYASHEIEAINSVTDARAKLAGAGTLTDMANADQQLTSALSRLLVVVENYPDLKADKQFTALSDELAGTENRIAVARKDYNDTVKTYNQKIRTFPTVIYANMFGFKSADYFEATQGAQNPPTVDFSK